MSPPGPVPAHEPQPVLAELTTAALFLTLTIADGGEEPVRDLLADLGGLKRTVAFRVPEQGLHCVVGVGSRAWDRLFGAPRPPGLRPFSELVGPRHRAPATAGDLLFHLRSAELGPCWELARLVTERLAGVCRIEDEVHGFGYFDRRDLLGFVDGTENPTGWLAAASALDAAGGSYVTVQKYLHPLADWNALDVAEQERVIGRTKADNVEFPDAAKPPDSHIALNSIDDPPPGSTGQIVRANMPFGDLATGQAGTYFIGYSAAPEVTELMLRRMFLGDDDGNTDRILDFSTAVTGVSFYAPPEGFLDEPAAEFLAAVLEPAAEPGAEPGVEPGAAPVPAPPPTPPAPLPLPYPADGSLGIGKPPLPDPLVHPDGKAPVS